jgi:hypothetical protein
MHTKILASNFERKGLLEKATCRWENTITVDPKKNSMNSGRDSSGSRYGPEGSLQSSQKPVTGLHPEQVESCPDRNVLFLND